MKVHDPITAATRTRHPQRDLKTDLERIAVLEAAFDTVIDSAVRERDGLKRRVAEIGVDASFLDPEPEAGNEARLTRAEAQMRATSARLARLEDQIRFFERMRSQLATRHAIEPEGATSRPQA